MKNGASKLKVFRTSTSPYFPADFNAREKTTLESLGVEMVSHFPCDILITNTHTDFSKISVDHLHSLKLILHPNSGYDNYSKDVVESLKCDVVVGSSIRYEAVSEYILSALFNHVVSIPHQPIWEKARTFKRPLLSELKITILGAGHIGMHLKKSLEALNVKPVMIDPFKNLHGDFSESDVVILACGLNFSNAHMINAEFLNKCSDRLLLINAARGELVKTDDLVEFLKTHPEAFAVLDVFEQEPNDFVSFKGLKNIKTTSHIAGVFNSIDQSTINFEKRVIEDFLKLSASDFKNKYDNQILSSRVHAQGLL